MREFAVIGLGRFGSSVARTLASLGHSVLGIGRDAGRVQALAGELTHVVEADATSEEVLRALGLRNMDTVVVAIGNDIESSILITLLLKELGVPRVVAKAASDLHGKVLARVGADRVIFPERDMGVRVAHSLVTERVLDLMELTPDVSVVELTVGAAMAGRTLRELDLRARYGVTVLAVRRGPQVLVPFPADQPFREGDVLIAIGHNQQLARLEEEMR